jgi:hypothetical protein
MKLITFVDKPKFNELDNKSLPIVKTKIIAKNVRSSSTSNNNKATTTNITTTTTTRFCNQTKQ